MKTKQTANYLQKEKQVANPENVSCNKKARDLFDDSNLTTCRERSTEKEYYQPYQGSSIKLENVINLHRHVCSIAERCTCEKQFPVVKIGEGKYRIGNTKNIVFIRVSRLKDCNKRTVN